MNRQTYFFSAVLLLAAMMGSMTSVFAAEDPVYTTLFSNKAAKGHDVTGYFSEGKPVEGSDKFKTEYKGAEWLFASQENLDKFTADPEKYAPQYGGYCAYAAALGQTVSADPEQWTIHDGKLYLNYDKKINDVWRGDKISFIEKADMNWPTLLEK